MKKFFVTALVLLAFGLSANSQDFKPFRVDGGVGYGLPFNEGLEGGVIFYLEPKYEVVPQIAVGLRWEGTLFAGAKIEGTESSASAKLSSGFLATGDYYFTNDSFRPFGGIGLGLYSITGASSTVSIGGMTETVEIAGSTNFAAMARVGFDYSHFRVTASYNMAFAEEMFHYISFTVGFYIGGGKN